MSIKDKTLTNHLQKQSPSKAQSVICLLLKTLLTYLIFFSQPLYAAGDGLAVKYWNYDVAGNGYLFPTTSPDIIAITPTVDWSGDSPAAGIDTDRFAIRWEGQIEPNESGNHIFHTESDDGVRLWVDGQLIITNWTNHGPTWNASPEINLIAGQRYTIKMEFFENTGGAVARLHWQTPSNNTQRVIPQSQLYSTVAPSLQSISTNNACSDTHNSLLLTYSTTMTTGDSPDSAESIANYTLSPENPISSAVLVNARDNQFLITFDNELDPETNYQLEVNNVASIAGIKITPNPTTRTIKIGNTGSGLQANYWNYSVPENNNNFPTTIPDISKIDSTVDFNWAYGQPDTNILQDRFAIRWQGSVLIPSSGEYVFSTESDDGIRLWVNNKLVIDNWTQHGPTYDDSASISLNAGQRYNIKMEFFEQGGGATARLLWRTPTNSLRQVIPSEALFPCSAPLTPIIDLRFDEASWDDSENEVIDSSANNFHGQSNAAEPEKGLACNAARFDGESSIQVASNTVFNNIGADNSDYSVNFWLNLDENQPTGWRSIIHKGAQNEERTFAAWLRLNGDNKVHHRITTTSSSNQGINASSKTLQAGQWEQITLVKEGNTLKTYINGTLDSQVVISPSINNLGPLHIGKSPWYDGISGLMDELLIFDQALSSTEINNIRNNINAGNTWDGEARPCQLYNKLDHFRISYPKNGLTCEASAITIKACADALCSTLMTEEVDLTLSPATGWENNPVTLSNGETTLALNTPAVGNLTLSIVDNSLDDTIPFTCLADNVTDPTCSMLIAEAGFKFDIPPLTACKPTTDITIRALKGDTGSNRCVAALSGNQKVAFSSQYLMPATGTNAVKINETDIATTNPGTEINLSFDADGVATFTTQYNDAGQLNLTATYNGTDGTTITGKAGNDGVISKPVRIVSYVEDSAANCTAQNASCSRFKKAAENFEMKVKAACWTDDNDTNFTDNPATPNFMSPDSIGLSHTLIAPSGGVPGNISTTSFIFSAADQGIHTLEQSVSEVGVFEFNLTPPADYFGETLISEPSPAIGRFIPDHFIASTTNEGSFQNNACGFRYSGEPFSYSTAPQITVTAFNSATTPAITTNYRGGFAKLQDTDFDFTSPNTDANQVGTNNPNLVRIDWEAAVATLSDNDDGTVTLTMGQDPYAYIKEQSSQIAPFDAAVNLTYTQITDSDNVSTNNLPHTLQPSGATIHFGRVAIDSTYGSELTPLLTELRTETYNGREWLTNLDSCTALDLNTHLRLSNPDTSSGAVQSGTSTMTIANGASSATLTPLAGGTAGIILSSPGQDNQGYIDITSNIATDFPWLLGDYDNSGLFNDEARGRATFGLFKGNDNIIFRREQY